MRSRPWLALLAACSALAGLPARAQTAITPDAGTVRALGTTVTQAGRTFTIDGGTLAGANLFHSFTTFSLGLGDTAAWTRAAGAASVRNVISRVTGGQASQIAGVIDSTALPNASFIFVNPAGVLFTAGARVNVPGAAWFSTAGEVRFADGGRFAMATPGGSTLSMAAPESFGFVGGQGAVEIRDVGAAFASTSNTLSFSGSDVRFTHAAASAADTLVVRGLDLIGVGPGALNLSLTNPLAAAVAGAVEVRNSGLVITSDDAASGALRLSGGSVSLSGVNLISDVGGAVRGGDLRVQGAQIQVSASTLGASARAGGAAGALSIQGGDIDVDGGSIFTVTTTAAPGGDLSLSASGGLTVRGGASVTSTNSAGGVGGRLALSAGELTLDNAVVVSSALGAGAGGHIVITAPTIHIGGGLAIATSLGAARPGDVTISGAEIDISGGSFGSVPGLVSDSGAFTLSASKSIAVVGASFTASSTNENGAGAITIRAPQVLLTEARLQADNFGAGGSGTILVDAGTLVLDETSFRVEANGAPGNRLGLVRLRATGDLIAINSQITSNTNDRASGGIVDIIARNVRLMDTNIRSDTVGLANGPAGRVSITATDTLWMSNGLVTSNSNSNGAGGGVTIEAGAITLDTAAAIRADTFDAGDAGSVAIKARSLTMLEGSAITSRAQSGTGDAGTVTIEADKITLTDSRISSGTDSFGDAGIVAIKVGDLVVDGARRGFTFITSETQGAGAAGGVFIDAKSIKLIDQGFISSDTFADGDAGAIAIRTDTLDIVDGSYISSDSQGAGDAGGVSIRAGVIRVTGGDRITYISSDSLDAGNAGEVEIQAKSLILDMGGFVSSDTYATGDAGDVTIEADTISLDRNANIRSSTLSNGDAGNVEITAKTLTLDRGAAVSSEATATSVGDAGFIEIDAETVTLRALSRVSTSSRGEGDAGALTITAKTLNIENGLVSSAAEVGAQGASGALAIEAGSLNVVGGGAISTVSNNANPAGLIAIDAGTLLVDGVGSLISSENQAGNVRSGNAAGERGDAGSVLIAADSLTVSNGGRISTNAFAGAAGEIVIGIDRPGLLVLEGAEAPGVIQTSSGAGTGGRITISDPLAIVSNGGSILALGQQRGANVVIQSRYFINSTDRVNTVAVDGQIEIQTGLYDVSSGIVSRDLSVLDASKVLRGQCPAARSTGAVSQLITRPVGPYARDVSPDGVDRPQSVRASGAGGCP